MNTQTSTPLLVDYYPGAYGPTIHIALNSREQLTTLLTILRALADGETEFDLPAGPEIQLSGLAHFRLTSRSDNDTAPKSLTVVTDDSGLALWKQSRSAWARTTRLVEVFVKDDTCGHQYLTEEGIDDAIVEVAYKE